MSTLSDYGCTGILTIGSTVMNGPGWDAPDLVELWHVIEQRGQDRILPGAAGVIPYQRRETVTRIDIDLVIVGSANQSGTPFADIRTGLATNIGTIMTGVVNPTGTTDGTRAASLTVPGLTTRTTSLHVLGLRRSSMLLDPANGRGAWEGVLQLSIPVKFT
jgi:hypothetical protein